MFSSNNSQVANDAVFVEDIFSTTLYTGNGSTQTITNGIDLAGKGGLVWTKARGTPNGTVRGHYLFDGSGSSYSALHSNTTGSRDVGYYINYNADGFSFPFGDASLNNSGDLFASWTFRKQPKFFDVVTWTGDLSGNRTLSHALTSTPACIIIKATNAVDDWYVYHTSLGTNKWLYLNTTSAEQSGSIVTAVSSTTFTVSQSNGFNTSGRTYVAYLFAHDAGGFGLTGTDNVISCGSFTTGSGGKISAPVNLGYEAQWLLAKNIGSAENWVTYDIMRGMSNTGYAALNPNSSGAEYTGTSAIAPTATGFDTPNASGPFASSATYIYIAIRRGPMKVPTSGTKVFAPVARTGTGTSTAVTTPNFPPDMLLQARRGAPDWPLADRLRGAGQNLATCYTSAESTPSPAYVESFDMTGATLGSGNAVNGSGLTYIEYFYRRAPSFFDEVCYTGANGLFTRTHNLGVAPELVIIKNRTTSSTWDVLYAPGSGLFGFLNYNLPFNYSGNQPKDFFTADGTTYQAPTSTTLYLNNYTTNNYVAYLFATCAGVQYINSYVGDGTTGRTINCGFTGGARFVCIKATSTTGSWWTFDSARGIVTNNDPALQLNSTAAEVTSADAIDTASSGFIVNQEATCSLNASGVTYLVWAIA